MLFLVVLLGLLTMVVAPSATAQSVYVISETSDTNWQVPMRGYDLAADGKLTPKAEGIAPMYGAGAIGLAADPKSNRLFVTYMSSNAIELLDADTLESVGTCVIPDARNLDGIVYDNEKGLVYCVRRETDTLYVLRWEPTRNELTPVPGSPFHLEGAEARGIALDEIRDELYVGGLSPSVRVYSTSDWHLIKTITVSRPAVCVAVDPLRNYLYFGGGHVENYFLGQYDLAGNTENEVRIDRLAGAMGIAVEPATGFVVISTGSRICYCGHNLAVYDSSLTLLDTTPALGLLSYPAGVVVSEFPTPLPQVHLTKTVETASDQETAAELPKVVVGEEVTYSICVDSNDVSLTDVSIVDRLPAELAFVRATGDGVCGRYDSLTHTYTWSDPPLSADNRTCLELVCRLDPNTPADRLVTNSAALSASGTTPATAQAQIVATAPGVYLPLHVSKTVVNSAGDVIAPALLYPGSEVIYRIRFDNLDNVDPVEHVRVIDTLPPQMEFVGATDDGSFGYYEPLTHTYTWFYPRLLSGESSFVDLAVRLNEEVAGGSTITNCVSIESDNTAVVEAAADVQVVSYMPLRLKKTLVGGVVGKPDKAGRPRVQAGSILTYAISLSNPSTNGTATQVSIVDTLPNEVSFITADGDRDFGFYDPNTRTYTWRYGSLAPGAEQSLNIVVQVNDKLDPNTVIANSATISSNQTAPTAARCEAVVQTPPVVYTPLLLQKTLVEGALGEPDSRGRLQVEAGSTITYALSLSNPATNGTVTRVSLVDTLPPELSFVRADGDGELGSYDPVTRTYTWQFALLAPGAQKYVNLVVQVDDQLDLGAVISNSTTLHTGQTPPTSAGIDVVVGEAAPPAVYAPLGLWKMLDTGAVGQPDSQGRSYVSAGSVITYRLCLSNPVTNGMVTQISLVDTLPAEVSFVGADGDGDFGFYDPNTRTYKWQYPSLASGVEKCLNLVVRVNDGLDPNTVIDNAAIVSTSQTLPTRAHLELVVYATDAPPAAEVQGQMYIKPDRIYRNNSTAKASLMVVVHLPEGIGMGAISNSPLVLTPGNVRVTSQQIFGTGTQGKVLCFFYVDAILAATQGYGEFPIRVTGMLNDGRAFSCETTLWIVKFGGP